MLLVLMGSMSSLAQNETSLLDELNEPCQKKIHAICDVDFDIVYAIVYTRNI